VAIVLVGHRVAINRNESRALETYPRVPREGSRGWARGRASKTEGEAGMRSTSPPGWNRDDRSPRTAAAAAAAGGRGRQFSNRMRSRIRSARTPVRVDCFSSLGQVVPRSPSLSSSPVLLFCPGLIEKQRRCNPRFLPRAKFALPRANSAHVGARVSRLVAISEDRSCLSLNLSQSLSLSLSLSLTFSLCF